MPFKLVKKSSYRLKTINRRLAMFKKWGRFIPVFALLLFSLGFISLSLAFDMPWAHALSSSTFSTVTNQYKGYPTDSDLIRVGIVRSGIDNLAYSDMQISGTAGLRVFSVSANNTPLLELPVSVPLNILRKGPDGFMLTWVAADQQKQERFVSDVLRVEPLTASGLLELPSIQRRGKVPQYRGVFEMIPDTKKPELFTAVNVLPLKNYLAAVVPNELPLSFGLEAVKAQAVLARNYAINPREKPWKTFDICDTEYCQAYYGAGSEDAKVNQILAQTMGQVALYQGEPILALYSSTNGGVSENNENVFPNAQTGTFPGDAVPYLRGRSDYPIEKDLSLEENARWFYTSSPQSFDVNSPLYRWTRTFTGPEFALALEKNLKSITSGKLESSSIKRISFMSTTQPLEFGQLQGVKVLKRGVSGKILELQIQSNTGVWVVNKEYTVRKLFENNGKSLPSANFVITETKNAQGQVQEVKLNGGGFGHGVGMSQYGAGWMAQHGFGYGAIIRHYYKDVVLGTVPIALNASQPRHLQFMMPASRARLCLEGVPRAQAQVSLNGKALPTSVLNGSVMVVDVSSSVEANAQNTLQVVSTGPARVWLEF